MVSPAYVSPMIKGIRFYFDNPFKFDFLVDSGYSYLEEEELKYESEKLIKLWGMVCLETFGLK